MEGLTRQQLLRILSSLPVGRHSLDSIASQANVDSKLLLRLFTEVQVGSFDKGVIHFTRADRIKLAIEAVKAGAGIDEVSRHLGWEDFEGLVEEVLGRFEYRTIKNLRLKRPRVEIDVVGIRGCFALVVDCKRWRRGLGISRLKKAAELQAKRAEALMASPMVKEMDLIYAIPILLTLYAEQASIIDGVPIVPIAKLSGFLAELDGYLSSLRLIIKLVKKLRRVARAHF
ncbi:MAG: hypothetical protein QW815_08875 [Nitrososphaerota archaeon]